MTSRQIERIRLSWRDLLPHFLEPAKSYVNGETSYVCPFCSHGAHGDGLTFDPHAPGRLHCFGCGWSGDVIDIYKSLNSCNFNESVESLSMLLGIADDDHYDINFNDGNFTRFILQSQRDFPASPADSYLKKRGISTETAIASGVGFCQEWRHPKVSSLVTTTPRLIIPTSLSSYLARDIRPTASLSKNEKKYCKQKVGTVHFLGFEKIKNAAQPVFIVEGEIDALSLKEIGKIAVALGSVSCVNLFIKEISQSKKPIQPFIVALDNDTAGINASKQLLEALAGQGIIAVDGHEIVGRYKDANEALIGDRSEFKRKVEEIEQVARRCSERENKINEFGPRSALTVVSTKTYLEKGYESDIKQFSRFAQRKTGFPNLDAVTTLYPGLYALGGISSLGKTTFVHQMADQLAAIGEHVLYFPIEQSTMELVSKGISRTMYQEDPETAVPSIRLRSGYTNGAIQNAQKKYAEKLENFHIAECNFNTTVMEVRDTVLQYAESTAISPIVVVDYLQALRSPDIRMAPREAIDLSLRVLKDLQTELAATIIIISSLNRGNYLVPIGFESFKESGGIEYTCDVVWGIDLFCMGDPLFDTQGQVKKKREVIDRAKSENPRKVRLVCLKNRYGISSYKVNFEYFPVYDTFISMSSEKEMIYSSEKKEEDFFRQDELSITAEERESIISMFLE